MNFLDFEDLIQEDSESQEIFKQLTNQEELMTKIDMNMEVIDFLKVHFQGEYQFFKKNGNNPEIIQKRLKFFETAKGCIKKLKVLKTHESSKFKTNLSSIQSKVKLKIEQISKEIDENENFQQYQEKVQQVTEKQGPLIEVQTKYFDLIEQKRHLEFKLGKITLESLVDFVIPRDEIAQLDMELNKHNVYFHKIKRQEFTEDKGSLNQDELDMIEAEDFIAKNHGFWENKRSDLEDKSFQMNSINNLESHIDRAIGELFANVYNMANGTKCFMLPQLSFYFFNMLLNNFIIDEKVFLKQFLKSIPPQEAKKFIIGNYRVFSSEKYVNQQISMYQETVVSRMTDLLITSMINEYTSNFSMVFGVYKDMVYSKRNDLWSLVKTNSIITTIYFNLRSVFNFSKDLTKDTLVTLVMSMIADIIISLVPFLGSVPFLKVLTVKILCRIYKVVEFLLFKTFQFGKSQTQKYFGVLQQKISDRKNKSNKVLDLDFVKMSRSRMSISISNPLANTNQEADFKKMGEKYALLNNANSWKKNIDYVNLFEPSNYLLTHVNFCNEENVRKYKALEFYQIIHNSNTWKDLGDVPRKLSPQGLLSAPKFLI
jgi:hypothetical protein